MKIKWLGQSTFVIDNNVKLITDPHDTKLGKFPHGLSADLVTISHAHDDHNYAEGVTGNPQIINQIGSFNVKGINIKGIKTFHDNKNGSLRGDNIVYSFTIEDINFCHLGDLGHLLSPEQIKNIGNVNILMIPVGGTYTIDATQAIQVINQLNPRIVIPMHYKPRNSSLFPYQIETVDKFVKLLNWDVISGIDEFEINHSKLDTINRIVILFNLI